jgi:hypothetical protein
MRVFKKAGKHGIVGVEVLGGAKIRRGYERPLQYGLTEYLAGYHWVADYLASFGVTFTSSSWASEQVFRIGLDRPLTLGNPLGRIMLKSSRGICYPGSVYKGRIEKWDIRSAYPYAMVSNAHNFPARFIPIEADNWDRPEPTIVLAHVLARPSYSLKDIPIIQEHPSSMDNPREQVVWLFDFEVTELLDHFHHVEIVAAFKLQTVDLSDEFGRWQEILSPRYAGAIGFAGKILKSITNAFWGSFAGSSLYAYSWTVDKYGNPVTDEYQATVASGRPGSEHVSAWVNALVSNRVFKEFIEPERVLYFDTDGGFCRPVTDSLGSGKFGEWRFEGYYHKLKVLGWQAYAAWADDGIEVVLSGIADATYKDLMKYGDDVARHDYISQLMEPNPFNQVSAVGATENLVSTIPPEIATLHPKRWLQIHRDIAPHAAQVNALYEDQAEVTALQAEGFRHLSKYSRKVLDTTTDPSSIGVSTKQQERKVHDGQEGNRRTQSQLWG